MHLQGDPTAEFRFSQLFIADGDSAVQFMHRVDVGSATDVSEVQAVSIFSTQINIHVSHILI
jgi:hypothetical protein